MAAPRAERGFILATTLLVMTLLTVMLTAAFVMVSAEYRSTNGSYSTTRALNFAQAGLQRYFSLPHTLTSGASVDSVNYTFSGGYARVVARKIRDSITATERALWIVYSTGVDSTRSLTTQGTASRVVAQLAGLQTGSIPTPAAMVAPNGVAMTASGTNPINGINTGFDVPAYSCYTPNPPNAPYDTIGLYTPTGEYGGSPGASPGGEAGGIRYLSSATEVIDTTRIDWQALVNGEFTPDYYGTLPSSGNTQYQSHYFSGNVTLPSGTRRGLLVAQGNVTINANAHWDGIIVAGGRLDANVNGTFYIHGMVITGLNIALGSSVSANTVRRGGSRYIQWDYCYAKASIASLNYLVPVAGTFTDSWKTY